MAKLTRYTSFEALKADTKAGEKSSMKNKKSYNEFEDFIKLLQKEATRKRLNPIKIKKEKEDSLLLLGKTSDRIYLCQSNEYLRQFL